ncbi:MAG: DUF429 domain-containing protein [Candidatus Glassbacteria bacterium]|nr:DUF429 domain-containing protein [Candidatus Glassbacteria bacterium]
MLTLMAVKPSTIVAGIDLAASPQRPSGVCLLSEKKVLDSRELYSDEEVIQYATAPGVNLAAIDAPLTLPPGRDSIDQRGEEHLRPCDRMLSQRGIRFFPITIGPMRELTRRGMSLKTLLEEQGVRTVEMYPGASQDVWGIPRKKEGLEKLRQGLAGLGIEGLKEEMGDHELDAITGAYTGYLFLFGQAEILGDFESGAIIIPKL